MYMDIRVYGTPAPKGSYRPVTNRRTGKTLLLPMSKNEKLWRKQVELAAQSAWKRIQQSPLPSLDEPVHADITFYLPRPKTVTRDYPTVKPDLDKLVRATYDGLTASHLIKDDSRIVSTTCCKRYVNLRKAGADITLLWGNDLPLDRLE